MASGEVRRGEAKNTAALERTNRLAKEAGEKAVAAANKILERHTDILDIGLITQIRSREFQTAFEDAKEAREEGRMNDDFSEEPGLTAFFTRRGAEMLREAALREAETVSHLSKYAAEIKPVEGNESLFSLRLPKGTYGMGMGGCQFYGEVEQQDGRRVVQNDPISMPYGVIVRIEGDHGEIWQNLHCDKDGTPRERE